MAKIVIIDACNECPYMSPHENCIYSDTKGIDNDRVIPDWCPLEDANQEQPIPCMFCGGTYSHKKTCKLSTHS